MLAGESKILKIERRKGNVGQLRVPREFRGKKENPAD